MGLFVFAYLAVTAISELGVGETIPRVASQAVMLAVLLVVFVASLLSAYSGVGLAASLGPFLAVATGMSAFFLANEAFGLDAVEADIPVEYGVLFYVGVAVALGVLTYALGRGTAWLVAR